jgi:hypothetical protein
VLFGVALSVALVLSVGQVIAAPNQTAQGIMVTLDANQNHALVENRQYEYNVATAATYFTNLWDTNPPVVTCSGSPTACANPAPTATTAPVPDTTKVTGPTGSAVSNKCTFLDGGTPSSSLYTQSLQTTVGTGSSRRTYTYAYTYNINPTGPVTAFTAWDLKSTTGGGTAQIDLTAQVAGESVVQNSQNGKVGTKFSFSIRNADGTNRVTNLNMSVDGTSYPLGNTIVENCPGCLAGATGAVDFLYTSNAGMNGNTALLVNGDARTILNGDAFAGNDNGGSDGTALAKAIIDQVTVNLGVGDYSVVLTGVVKGNNALANLSFSVGGTIHIIAPGCHD